MPKAFVVVGHSNWGKSHTLRELFGTKEWMEINGAQVWVKRMSNDDPGSRLEEFLQRINRKDKRVIVIAFCPNFKSERLRETNRILRILQSKYVPYFFVLKRKYAGMEEISAKELEMLEKYRHVNVYSDSTQATRRASALRAYIIDNTDSSDRT